MSLLSAGATEFLLVAMGDPQYGQEVVNAINGGTGAGRQAAVAINTVTATAGSLPTQDGATTIANTATPTVVELLDLCMELRAKISAIMLILHNYGITT